jgi:hypothetical protein
VWTISKSVTWHDHVPTCVRVTRPRITFASLLGHFIVRTHPALACTSNRYVVSGRHTHARVHCAHIDRLISPSPSQIECVTIFVTSISAAAAQIARTHSRAAVLANRQVPMHCSGISCLFLEEFLMKKRQEHGPASSPARVHLSAAPLRSDRCLLLARSHDTTLDTL